MEPIKLFMSHIFPSFQWAGEAAFFDTRKIDLEALENGNIKFSLSADGAGKYHLMTTIEVDPGCRFWVRVVEVVRVFTGATYTLPDELVASVATSLPGADLLTQEVVKDRRLPMVGPKAGGKLPGFSGTIKSRGKTKTRGESDDEDDVAGFIE